jgi:hypothetical protein
MTLAASAGLGTVAKQKSLPMTEIKLLILLQSTYYTGSAIGCKHTYIYKDSK